MLARGGMAVVYLVHQPALDRDVVLKRLDLEGGDPALAQRFVREARLAATLDHPNVVTLFDFFEHDGVPYIAMEYVAGGSLRELVGRLELPQVCGVVEGVLAGLGHAERQGIAHRDLKPENLLLTRRGTVKIADFGIARAYNALTQRLTAPGMAIGTPAYMAPEQATNEPLSPATDLYSLGVIAYELLAGRPPFVADTPVGCSTPTSTRPRRRSPRSSSPSTGRSATGSSGCSRRTPPGAPSRRRRHGMPWRSWRSRRWARTGAATRRSALLTRRPHGRPPTARRSRRPPRTARRPRARTPPASCRPRRRSRRPSSCRRPARAAGASGARPPRSPGPASRPRRSSSRAAGEPDPPAPSPRRRSPRAPRRRTTSTATARQELVMALLRGAPRGRSARGGVVLVKQRSEERPWSLITRGARRAAGAPARRRRLRLGPRQRGLRPRRQRRPGDRHARPRAGVRALRRRRRARRAPQRSSSRAAARTCRPARAATASCWWRATSTATATTSSSSVRPATATGSRGAARCTSCSAAPEA